MDYSQDYWVSFFEEYLSKLIENRLNAKLEFQDHNYIISYPNGTKSLIIHPFWSELYFQSLVINKSYIPFNPMDF